VRPCLVCNPHNCREHVLYVASDGRCVKIGITGRPAQRLAQYRKQNPEIVFVYSRPAGCQFTGWDREAKALRRLARDNARRGGDWFHATEEAAIGAVDYACGDYKGGSRT
jgi:hypothetical protein